MNSSGRLRLLLPTTLVALIDLGCQGPKAEAVDTTIAPPPTVTINAPVDQVAAAILKGKVMAGALAEGRLKVVDLPSGEKDLEPVSNGMMNLRWKIVPLSPTSTSVLCGVFGGIGTNAAGVWENRPLTENRTTVSMADAVLHKTLLPLKTYIESGAQGANPLDAEWSK